MRSRPSAGPVVVAVWLSVTLSAGLWIVLAVGLPWLQALPGWFWPLTNAPRTAPGWLALAGLVVAGVSLWIARARLTTRRRRWALGAVLVVLGVALQWCFALAEGRGHQALRDRLAIGVTDLVELAVWTGPPVALLAALGGLRALHRLATDDDTRAGAPLDDLGAALVVVVLALAFAGRTVGEVARLWLFLQPAIALLAAREMSRSPRPLRLGAMIVATQLLPTTALKLWMDFV